MATLLKDAFNGSGSLSGREPDIGRPGSPWSSTTNGVISGGKLAAVNESSFNYLDGGLRMPARGSAYTAISVYATFELAGADDVEVYVEFTDGWYQPVFYYGRSDGIVTQCEGPSAGIDPEYVNANGVNSLVVSMDIAGAAYTVFLNGVVAGTGSLPSEETGPPSTTFLQFNIGASTGLFDGTLLELWYHDIEVTDELYQPVQAPFWTNVIRAAETP